MPNPSTRRALTPAQQDTLDTLARLGSGGPISISISKLAVEADITPKQTEAALNYLLGASTVTKTWDPDKYVWTFTVHNTGA